MPVMYVLMLAIVLLGLSFNDGFSQKKSAAGRADGLLAAEPVCSNTEFPGDNGLVTAGQQWETRHLYYCPQGATSLQLLYTGAYAYNQPVTEVRLVDPQIMNLSIEGRVPPLWQAGKTYLSGAQVSGATGYNNRGEFFVALRQNVDSFPTATNTADWKLQAFVPIPVTCAGVRPCRLDTSIQPDGSTATDPFLATDPLVLAIPPGSLIAVRGWLNQSGSERAAAGPSQTSRGGSYQKNGAIKPDLTLSGGATPGDVSRDMGLFAIVGQQNVSKLTPTVCIVGDSRAVGLAGVGIRGGSSIASGGAGYVAADIGQLVRTVDRGMSADNVMVSGTWVIEQVAGGKVTQVAAYDPGHYASAVSGGDGDGSVNPVGIQPTTPVSTTFGSGLTISPNPTGGFTSSNGLHEDPATFAHGFIQKGLSDGGIPFASFSRASDEVAWWVATGGDTIRLQAIQRAGCTSTIIELGINDNNAGETATLIEQQLITLANQLLALGSVKGVYLATMPPYTSSNDYWKTTAGQTPNAHDGTRKAVNAWERGVPPPFSGTFDTAAPVEVNSVNVVTENGGYWIVNGTNHYATPDKIHLSPAAHDLAAVAISSRIDILQ